MIGVYRVVMYMCQREDAEKKGVHNPIPEHDDDEDGTEGQTTLSKKMQKSGSKMCTIL